MLRSVLCCFAVFGIVRAAPVPPGEQNGPLYFPTVAGTKCVYEFDGGQIVHVITTVERKEKETLVTVEKEGGDGRVPLFTLAASASGMRQITDGEQPLDEALTLLVLPAKQGDKWNVSSTTSAGKLVGTVQVAGVEDVEVGAGKFRAVRVEWDYKIGDAPQLRTYWYAPKVGMVKMKSRTGELRLKTITVAKN
jgi:hypothetical protein